MASSDSHQISDTTLKAQWQTLLSTIESHIKTFHSTTTLTPTLTNTPQLTPTLAGYFDDYSHLWLHQSQPTAPVLQKLLITWLHAAVFAKYIFGMSSAWNSQMGIISAAVAPEESPAAWRTTTTALLAQNPTLQQSRAAAITAAINQFEYLLTSPDFSGVRSSDAPARRKSLHEIVVLAVQLHGKFQRLPGEYEFVFLDRFVEAWCDEFDGETMEGVGEVGGSGELVDDAVGALRKAFSRSERGGRRRGRGRVALFLSPVVVRVDEGRGREVVCKARVVMGGGEGGFAGIRG